MGSKDKFHSIRSADKGTDDIGIAQATGTISAIASAVTAAGRSDWNGKLLLTVDSTVALKKGSPIVIAGLDLGHSGLTRILRVINSTQIIVNITYNASLVDVTGTWTLTGGAGAWDSLRPLTADIPGANLALTFWFPEKQGGSQVVQTYTKDQLYIFPGIIKTIQITTAGNVRLARSATLRPDGKNAQ